MTTTAETMTLTDFLLARIAEDEVVARAPDRVDWDADDAHEQDALHRRTPHASECGWRLGEGMASACECNYPARVLAECEAKRRIVNYFRVMRENAEQFDALRLSDADAVLTLLAVVYADHPDYRQEWRP